MKMVIRLGVAGLLALCWAWAQTTAAQTNELAQAAPSVQSLPNNGSCGTIQYVGREAGNPFSAQRVIESVFRSESGNEVTSDRLDLVARDSAGRVRFEKHGVAKPANNADQVTLNTRDGGTITASKEAYGTLIEIFDTPSGKLFTVQPAMQIAMVRQTRAQVDSTQPCHPFSFYFTSLLRGKTPSDLVVEDLGVKEIEGIPAHGIRTTQLGKEVDGEWNGQAIRVDEVWASDELAATVMEIHSNLKSRHEDRSKLIKIKREEPEASLFEVPAGYKINPTTEEMPFIKLQSKVTAP